MKAKLFTRAAITAVIAASMTTALASQPPKLKYTTEIPANVITPDKMETSIGTLNFVDGVPTKETAQKVWD